MKKLNKKNILQSEINIGSIKLIDKAVFAKNMSVMLRAGLTINESLEIAKAQAKGKFLQIISNIYKYVMSGNTFADSLAQYPKVFSQMFIEVTRSGESSGTLDASLDNIAGQLEKENSLKMKIKGAMIYPIVIMIASFVLGMFMAFVILPKIVPLFLGLNIELPLSTRILIWFASVVQNYGLILFFLIIIFSSLLLWVLRQKFIHPFTHYLMLKIPVMKTIVINANLARFNRTLGTLLRSGVVLPEALIITSNTVGNYYYYKAVKKISDKIATGVTLSENLRDYGKLFPKINIEMINVGESSGKLEDNLLYLADFYDMEVDSATKSLATVVEPLLLLVIGSVVALLALAIITPIYKITGNIKI